MFATPRSRAGVAGIGLRVQALREERYEAVVRELAAADSDQEKPAPRDGGFQPAGAAAEAGGFGGEDAVAEAEACASAAACRGAGAGRGGSSVRALARVRPARTRGVRSGGTGGRRFGSAGARRADRDAGSGAAEPFPRSRRRPVPGRGAAADGVADDHRAVAGAGGGEAGAAGADAGEPAAVRPAVGGGRGAAAASGRGSAGGDRGGFRRSGRDGSPARPGGGCCDRYARSRMPERRCRRRSAWPADAGGFAGTAYRARSCFASPR